MPRLLLLVALLVLQADPATGRADATEPVVVAHRGASALLPEHTLAAYAKAIADGADFIEPDLVATRDGVLVARHENEISGTTDVASHAEFATRRSTREIDGVTVSGWFTEDFTLAELKRLRARERLPQLRSTQYDGQFGIPTFEEVIEFVAAESVARGRAIGLIPELKHPTYFRGRDLALEDRLLDALASHHYTRTRPVIVQSFEIGALRTLRKRLGPDHANVRLLQLLGGDAEFPADRIADPQAPSYADMMQPDGLRTIATYAEFIGPSARSVVPLDDDRRAAEPTPLVRDAHAAGLRVFPYTYRAENYFLPRADWQGDDPRTVNAAGSIADMRAALDAGVDGFFTDDPGIGRRAVEEHARKSAQN